VHQLKLFCAERGLETFRVKRIEIYLMSMYLQPNCIENCQDQGFGK